MIDKLDFLGEEIVFKLSKLESKIENDIWSNSNMPHEKQGLRRFEVIKVGRQQLEIKEGDFILVNQNGLDPEIKIEGFGIVKDTYSLPTAKRIFCKINE